LNFLRGCGAEGGGKREAGGAQMERSVVLRAQLWLMRLTAGMLC
jgi:hypothetical protein